MLGHRKIPSFTLQKPKSDSEEGSSSRSRSRGRSISPFRSKKRAESHEGMRRDAGEESDAEGSEPVVCPSNAFDSDESDEDELSDFDSEDEELERNTEVSALSSQSQVGGTNGRGPADPHVFPRPTHPATLPPTFSPKKARR